MTLVASPPACIGCGCTDLEPCLDGCSWHPGFAAAGLDVCTRCAGAIIEADTLQVTAERMGIPPQPYVLLPFTGPVALDG